MITKTMIFDEIENRGYKVDVREAFKNGVKMEAFSLVDECEKHNAIPTFYFEKVVQRAFEKNLTVEEIVDEIVEMNRAHIADFDIDCLREKEFILSNVCIGLQKEGTEKLIKRKCDYEGIEAYLYLKVTVNGIDGTIKLNDSILDASHTSVDEAWRAAEKRLCEDTVIEPLANYFNGFLGEDDSTGAENYMFVLTNKSKVRGASTILNQEAITELGKKINVSHFVYLPSSIHESLLIPVDDNASLEIFKKMVTEVNHTAVNEEDRLIDNAYFLNV